ncbi:MAG: hypothetical protein GY894_02080 [Planctomycetes bacterium]|nr:hypothetical protein [Planctomycetota bacterium]
MFSIIADDTFSWEGYDGVTYIRSFIQLGNIVQRQDLPASFWRGEDYELSWRRALTRIAGGASPDALFRA